MMKKESFILVHAGEAPAPEIIQLEPEHLLDGMYQAIHCDCIEIVRVQTGFCSLTVLCWSPMNPAGSVSS